SSRFLGLKIPGVSTSTTWARPDIAIPRMIERVVCTLWLTIETLVPTRRLIKVDLPALGAPISATKPQRVGVSSVGAPIGVPDALADQTRCARACLRRRGREPTRARARRVGSRCVGPRRRRYPPPRPALPPPRPLLSQLCRRVVYDPPRPHPSPAPVFKALRTHLNSGSAP